MPDRTCSVNECHRPTVARGWCNRHYSRWQRTGDPTTTLYAEHGSPLSLLAAAASAPPHDCVLWPYATNSSGYGVLRVGRARRYAHQLSLELSGRPRPAAPADFALHSCHVPLCVNPAHLRWGTAMENAQDRLTRQAA